MDQEIDIGNQALTPKIGYIVGDQFSELTQLGGVFTIEQFFKQLFENSLPKHQAWIIGQGIDASVRHILHLCEKYSQAIKFQYSSQDTTIPQSPSPAAWEWHQLQFTEATRLIAELKLIETNTRILFTQSFVFSAASDLTERACQIALPECLLVTKQAQLHCFHRLLPLPLRVEVQFHIMSDNKRTLKSMTRFYQDMHCAAEAILLFDLYSKDEAQTFIQELSEKTLQSFESHLNTNDS